MSVQAPMTYWENIIALCRMRHGGGFDPSNLEERFARYYFSKERIRVKDNWGGDILSGTVSLTAGYKPSFMLMRTSRSIRSHILLNRDFEILGVQQKGYKKYSKPY